MRERWARVLALVTGVLVVLLTIAFATVQNRGDAPASTSASSAAGDPAIDPKLLAAGRAVYDAAGCARCHSIAGQGSPRSPLDGIGTRRNREDLRHWIVADEPVHDELSPHAIGVKRRYADLPVEQLDALVAYLTSLNE
jgi:mono/diheme cytochrome c family protein